MSEKQLQLLELHTWLILAAVCFGVAGISMGYDIGVVYLIAGLGAMAGFFMTIYHAPEDDD